MWALGGPIKSLNRQSCTYYGSLRDFVIYLIWNTIFAFMAAAMAFNYHAINRSAKERISLKSLKSITQVADVRILYLLLLAASSLLVFFNNILVKYNSDVWCNNTDNY